MSQRSGLRVAVVGATGAVGTQLIQILEQRKIPVEELVPFASARSSGKPILFNKKNYPCKVLSKGCFQGIDIAFFDASDAVSKEWVPQAAQEGAWVVDNSATFRYDNDIPIVVPEINGSLVIERAKSKPNADQYRRRILTGPNCSTAQMVVALKPIRDHWGLKRVVVSTYQSTSGAGTMAMQELRDQAAAELQKQKHKPAAFAHKIAFNCIPQIGGFKPDGYTSEESKMIQESRKILDLPELAITATAVRVPTFSCHGESVNVETERPFEDAELRAAFGAQEGLLVIDEPARNLYPMGEPYEDGPVERASGNDLVYVGRIRRDFSIKNGVNFWVVSDNLRKGAALNAIQMGEILIPYLLG